MVRDARRCRAPHHEDLTVVRWEDCMKLGFFAAALVAAFSLASPSHAETYPSRPITVIVPFSAGGPSDAMMRILGERMKDALGKPLVIENVTGAGGSIGVARTVHS